MPFHHITFENTDRCVRIGLNRPTVLNALHPESIAEITAAFKAAASDDTVRVVVLTGEGDKAFCSGADLKTVLKGSENIENTLKTHYNPMIMAIRNLPKPVICRLNGLATGAGASLALACDLIIASENAYLSQIFVQIGLMPDAGATFFLPRLIGPAKAFELMSTGRRVYMAEALQLGLINKVVSDTDLDAAIGEATNYYEQAPTRSIGAIKAAMNLSFESNLSDMLDFEAKNQQMLIESRDANEGIMSFLQKKKPDFQGK
jgi:2-(1,2-epoxy-1,2-dihydrophenyl)acetyl-CoA isomerase